MAREARVAAKIAPAALAAARALRWASDGHGATLRLGSTSVTVRHDDRYRGYVALALIAGAALGAAATLLLAPDDSAPKKGDA